MIRRKYRKIYITFSVTIKKEHDNNKTITEKIKFVDSFRFMQSALSDLVNNISEINNKDCKTCIKRKQNVILLGLKIID